MSAPANVTIHPSQFPDAIRRDLLASLRRRQVNHKFHYDSPKQTQQWLALHQQFSPSRNDADCEVIYDQAFAAVAKLEDKQPIHLIGLGCGGGQKDTRLLKLLQAGGGKISYTPSDVSVAMTLVARQTALAVIDPADCSPLVCDLATADDLPSVLNAISPASSCRLITFFGMIPNFDPDEILPRLAACLRPGEPLLFSANLAPGADYHAGVERVLPQYDNAPTRDWLLTFLLDLGVERSDGEVHFAIETVAGGFKRIVARFHFIRDRVVMLEAERFAFRAGESLRLFFSCRYTPANLESLLAHHGFDVQSRWLTRSGEEGVWLCGKALTLPAAAR
jgi:uncharacterized SAM-dependent methyltransferase